MFGCAMQQPPPKLDTPSGLPEVTIPFVNRKAVIDHIVAAKLSKGLKVYSVSDYGVTAGQIIDKSIMASLFYGSRYDSFPEARIRYNIVEDGNAVKVFTRVEMVTNPGSAFERVTDVTNQVAQMAQRELYELKAKLAYTMK